VLEQALKDAKGNIEDKNAFMKALKSVNLKESLRGPMHFDQYGNVVGNNYIRKVERKDGKLVNAVVKTYPDVSQFWTYKPEEFLKQPVYSRDFPPAKNLEQ
jgi:branched-chain amino acid transport system substrate-binding protein